MCISDNLSEVINQLMHLLPFLKGLLFLAQQVFNIISALSNIVPISASLVTESLPPAGL